MAKARIVILAMTVIMILSMYSTPARGASAEIEVQSDLQILDLGNIYGGHITWALHGEVAKELRSGIGEKYGVHHIDMSTASRYFKHDLERVIENNLFGCGYLAFVRVNRADPLHDDTQGILNDENDVEGLLGDVNSTADITIRMLIRGEPTSGKHLITTENLTFAPFYALVNNASELSKFNLNGVKVSISHSEIIAGLGSMRYPDGTFTLRLILGQYFMAHGSWVEYSSFDPLNSPLVLFILFAAAAFGMGKMVPYVGNGKEGTLMERNAIRFATGMKLGMFLTYLLIPAYGIWYIVVLAIMLGAGFMGLKKIYGS